MDADFSHHPATLSRMLQASRYADLVLGSRYIPGGRTVNWPAYRKLISRGGSLYARALLNLPVRDLTGGFKCFRRHVLESIDLDTVNSTGYAFQIELTYRAAHRGFRIIEIPITFAERRLGKSKMDRSIVLEAVLCVMRLRLLQPRPSRPVALPFQSPGESTGL
jgi:dolichol-phosphate mannosyltransferase